MLHNRTNTVTINSNSAIDHGSTAPCASVVNTRATMKPTAITLSSNKTINGEWIPRLCTWDRFEGEESKTIVRCELLLSTNFSKFEIVEPHCAMRRIFVTEFGVLLNCDDNSGSGCCEFYGLMTPSAGPLLHCSRCRDAIIP